MNTINWLTWLQNNWSIILIIESTIASFLPIKYNGIVSYVWQVIQNGVAPKTTVQPGQNITAQAGQVYVVPNSHP